MLRLVSHLEKLLMVHDCVIVPNFGGFVLQSVSASYEAEKHLFTPMHKEIVFNATLKHNDGLLIESYMREYDVNYSRAYRMLSEDVEDIQSSLYKGVNVALGDIGSFYLGFEGQFIFKPGHTAIFSMESYGLSPCKVPTLRSLQREEVDLLTGEKRTGRDIFYIPVNRKLLRGITATAAAIALFLMVSTPVKEINADTYTASFIPVEMVSPKAASTQAAPVRRAESQTVITPRVEQEQNSSPGYYVVISSVNSVAQADQLLSELDRTVYKRAGKIVGSRMVRVYVDKFDTREKADACVNRLREGSRFYDAWVYTTP